MVMALPVPRRRMGAGERQRSRALCTSHLGDEKNETAVEKGKKGKATEWCSFQNKFPRVGRGAERDRERGGEGALPANVAFSPFSRIMKDPHLYIF